MPEIVLVNLKTECQMRWHTGSLLLELSAFNVVGQRLL